MSTAAVPQYLGQSFRSTPPGHRYTLYGSFWEPAEGWVRMKNIDPAALQSDFGTLAPEISHMADALRLRQQEAAPGLGSSLLSIQARSSSPFVTGTGIEHPLENGMAFQNPYGLPVLPGSSVKGVLRRAADELVSGMWGDSRGWDSEAIQILFGRETNSGGTEAERTRGALSFWDVYPACRGLRVEIMNPHYGDYYQGKSTPHDAGQPIPIPFLVVPEGSAFTLYVHCDTNLLPRDWMRERWRNLILEIFDHAGEWAGFGAKTSVGYGAMARDKAAEEAAKLAAEQEAERKAAEEVQRARQKAEMEEAAFRQAEFDALPESRKAIQRLQERFTAFRQCSQVAQGQERGELNHAINDLVAKAPGWESPTDREEAAALLEQIYGAVGWHEPGVKKKDRRLKQENKRRAAIARIRNVSDA